MRPTSEHRLARRHQQLFWRPVQAWYQQQQHHLTTPIRQKLLVRQEKEGPRENSLIRKSERKIKLSV